MLKEIFINNVIVRIESGMSPVNNIKRASPRKSKGHSRSVEKRASRRGVEPDKTEMEFKLLHDKTKKTSVKTFRGRKKRKKAKKKKKSKSKPKLNGNTKSRVLPSKIPVKRFNEYGGETASGEKTRLTRLGGLRGSLSKGSKAESKKIYSINIQKRVGQHKTITSSRKALRSLRTKNPLSLMSSKTKEGSNPKKFMGSQNYCKMKLNHLRKGSQAERNSSKALRAQAKAMVKNLNFPRRNKNMTKSDRIGLKKRSTNLKNKKKDKAENVIPRKTVDSHDLNDGEWKKDIMMEEKSKRELEDQNDVFSSQNSEKEMANLLKRKYQSSAGPGFGDNQLEMDPFQKNPKIFVTPPQNKKGTFGKSKSGEMSPIKSKKCKKFKPIKSQTSIPDFENLKPNLEVPKKRRKTKSKRSKNMNREKSSKSTRKSILSRKSVIKSGSKMSSYKSFSKVEKTPPKIRNIPSLQNLDILIKNRDHLSLKGSLGTAALKRIKTPKKKGVVRGKSKKSKVSKKSGRNKSRRKIGKFNAKKALDIKIIQFQLEQQRLLGRDLSKPSRRRKRG